MGIFDGISDGMFSAGASLLGGIMRNQTSYDIASQANQFSAQQFATRYQTQVRDLQAAGLNPMLAYMQSPGSSPVGQQATVQDVATPAAQTYFQGKMNSAQVANVEADTKNKEAQADLIQAQALQAKASAAHLSAGVGQIEATVDKIREEIKNIPLEGNRLRALYVNLVEHSALMAQQGQTEVDRRKNLQAITAKLYSEKAITDADLEAIRKTDGIGRIAREVKPISDMGADWLSPGKWLDKFLPNASKSRSSTTRERGTYYDRDGNPSGGFSRERNQIER